MIHDYKTFVLEFFLDNFKLYFYVPSLTIILIPSSEYNAECTDDFTNLRVLISLSILDN